MQPLFDACFPTGIDLRIDHADLQVEVVLQPAQQLPGVRLDSRTSSDPTRVGALPQLDAVHVRQERVAQVLPYLGLGEITSGSPVNSRDPFNPGVGLGENAEQIYGHDGPSVRVGPYDTSAPSHVNVWAGS